MAAKHKSLSLPDKIKILKVVAESAGQHVSKGRIAKEFSITKSTLYTIIEDKDKIVAAFNHGTFEPERKRMRTSVYEDVEEALLI